MTDPSKVPVPRWRRALAYCWYAWGLSWCYWGIRGADQSLFRSGIQAFDRAIHTWPEFPHAFYRRGLIRGRELSEYDQGIADLTQAIELLPDWPEPYLQRGLFQRFHGNLQAALDDLSQYIKLGGSSEWHDEASRQIATIQVELAEAQKGPAAGEA